MPRNAPVVGSAVRRPMRANWAPKANMTAASVAMTAGKKSAIVSIGLPACVGWRDLIETYASVQAGQSAKRR